MTPLPSPLFHNYSESLIKFWPHLNYFILRSLWYPKNIFFSISFPKLRSTQSIAKEWRPKSSNEAVNSISYLDSISPFNNIMACPVWYRISSKTVPNNLNSIFPIYCSSITIILSNSIRNSCLYLHIYAKFVTVANNNFFHHCTWSYCTILFLFLFFLPEKITRFSLENRFIVVYSKRRHRTQT